MNYPGKYGIKNASKQQLEKWVKTLPAPTTPQEEDLLRRIKAKLADYD